VGLSVEWGAVPLEVHHHHVQQPRGWDAETVRTHRDSGRYLEEEEEEEEEEDVPILLMVNGQEDMDPLLRTTRAIPPFLHDLLRMDRGTLLILREHPLVLVVIQKTVIHHEDLVLATATQTIAAAAILHELLPILLELLNMALAIHEDLLNTARAAAIPLELPSMVLAAAAAAAAAVIKLKLIAPTSFEYMNGLLINF